MTGDPRCPHCRAPEPIVGETQHARDCPLARDKSASRFREVRANGGRKAKAATA